jgi:hypothetical protein
LWTINDRASVWSAVALAQLFQARGRERNPRPSFPEIIETYFPVFEDREKRKITVKR